VGMWSVQIVAKGSESCRSDAGWNGGGAKVRGHNP
jgi:hypothetical protein